MIRIGNSQKYIGYVLLLSAFSLLMLTFTNYFNIDKSPSYQSVESSPVPNNGVFTNLDTGASNYFRYEENGKKPICFGNSKIDFYGQLEMTFSGSNLVIPEIRFSQTGKEQIIYSNIYDGIDLIFEDNDGCLKYSFIITPRGHPELIMISFSGEKISLSDDKLTYWIHNHNVPVLIDEGLCAWNDVESIPVFYKLINSTTLSYEIADYDKTLTLVIDPVIYSSAWDYDAGSFSYDVPFSGIHDKIMDVAINEQGDSYVLGTGMRSFRDPVYYYPTGEKDVFLAKIKKSGRLIEWSQIIGNEQDIPQSLAIDSSGNLVVVGKTTNPDFYVSPSALFETFSNQEVAFVRVYNPNGILCYSSFFPEEIRDLACYSDHIILCGYTTNEDFETTPDAYGESHNGGFDIYLTCLEPISSDIYEIEYSTLIGGSNIEIPESIRVDSIGRIYITGRTNSPDFPITSGAFDTSPNGGYDMYLSRINPSISGNDGLEYSTFFGTSSNDGGFSLDLDTEENVVLLGYAGVEFPTTSTSYRRYMDIYDAYIFLKIDPVGNGANDLLYSSYFESVGLTSPERIFSSYSSGILIVGETTNSSFPVTADAFDTLYNGGTDIFFTLIDLGTEGNTAVTYSSYYGGLAADYIEGAILDEYGNIIFVGYTQSSDCPDFPGSILEGDFIPNSDLLFGKIQCTKNMEPLVSEAPDMEAPKGQFPAPVTWEIADESSFGQYEIYVNSSLHSVGIWESGIPVIFDVNSFLGGTYSVEIAVYDGNGAKTSSTTKIVVYALVIYGPANNTIYTGNLKTLKWTIVDNNYNSEANYVLLLNGEVYSTGSWTNNSQITFDLSGLKPGMYEFRLIAFDGTGEFREYDSVIELRMTPPFYQSPTFIAIVVVLLVSVCILVIMLIYSRRERMKVWIQAPIRAIPQSFRFESDEFSRYSSFRQKKTAATLILFGYISVLLLLGFWYNKIFREFPLSSYRLLELVNEADYPSTNSFIRVSLAILGFNSLYIGFFLSENLKKTKKIEGIIALIVGFFEFVLLITLSVLPFSLSSKQFILNLVILALIFDKFPLFIGLFYRKNRNSWNIKVMCLNCIMWALNLILLIVELVFFTQNHLSFLSDPVFASFRTEWLSLSISLLNSFLAFCSLREVNSPEIYEFKRKMQSEKKSTKELEWELKNNIISLMGDEERMLFDTIDKKSPIERNKFPDKIQKAQIDEMVNRGILIEIDGLILSFIRVPEVARNLTKGGFNTYIINKLQKLHTD